MRDSNDLFFASLIAAFGLVGLHGAAQLTIAPMIERSPALFEVASQVSLLLF
jgi:hypothetical protein